MITEFSDLDKALDARLPTAFLPDTAFSESDIRDVLEILFRLRYKAWSHIPRVYSVLRLVGCSTVIDSFIDASITDVTFPFTQGTLPEAIKSPTTRADSLKAQSSVLTKSLDLEKEDGRHRHLASADDAPFVKVAELGKGLTGMSTEFEAPSLTQSTRESLSPAAGLSARIKLCCETLRKSWVPSKGCRTRTLCNL